MLKPLFSLPCRWLPCDEVSVVAGAGYVSRQPPIYNLVSSERNVEVHRGRLRGIRDIDLLSQRLVVYSLIVRVNNLIYPREPNQPW